MNTVFCFKLDKYGALDFVYFFALDRGLLMGDPISAHPRQSCLVRLVAGQATRNPQLTTRNP